MDEIRKERRPLYSTAPIEGHPRYGEAVNAAASNPTEPELRDAFAALNAFADKFVMYRDRVAELDQRLATVTAERDGARERAAAWDIDRHTERDRADRLQREATFYQDARRQTLEDLGRVAQERDAVIKRAEDHVCVVRGHVCTERCKPNSHVSTEGRHRLQEAEALVIKLERERDEARQFGDTLTAQLERTIKSRDEAQEARDAARRERDERYTAAQVGNLQASEAELVSAPLKASLATARNRVASLEAGLAKEMKSNASLANQAAEELGARRECERQVHAALERVRELEDWLGCREARQREAENLLEIERRKVATLKAFLVKVADTVSAEAVGQAIDPENPDFDTDPSHATLRNVARQVRHEIRRTQATLSNSPCGGSTWKGRTPPEGSPASPTE